MTNTIAEYLKAHGQKRVEKQPSLVEVALRIKRAILYARVSTDEQNKEGKVSLDQQITRCREYAERNGMVVVAEFREDYTGTKHRRPEMDKVMQMFSEGQADALIVMCNDRFHRAVSVFYILWEELKLYHAELHFTDNGMVDENNLGNLIVLGVQNVMSEGERRKIVGRMIDAKHEMALNRNIPVMGPPAYGLVKTGKHILAIDEAQAKVVQDIFNWFAYGNEVNGEPPSSRTIASWLTSQRIPGSTHGTNHPKTGNWSPAMVINIVNNPIYCGHYFYGKTKVVAGKRTPAASENWKEIILPPEITIVSEQTWRLANKRLESNKRISKRPFRVKYLLSGHVWCGNCGRRMRSSIAGHPIRNKDTGEIIGYYRRYSCGSINNDPENQLMKACSTRGTSISCNIVEAAVVEWLRQLLENPDDIKAGIERMTENSSVRANPLEDRLRSIRAAIQAQTDAIMEYSASLPSFKDKPRLRAGVEQSMIAADETREELERQAKEVEDQLGETIASIDDLNRLHDLAPALLERLDSATWEDLRWLVDVLDLRVTIRVDPNDTKKRSMEVQCVFSPEAIHYRLKYHPGASDTGYEGPVNPSELGLIDDDTKMGESV